MKGAPQYKYDDEIDKSFEGMIRRHFGLGDSKSGSSYGGRATDASGAEGAAAGDNTVRGDDLDASGSGSREPVGREEYRNSDNYVSDSAMASAAGGATASGGMSDFETGDRESRREGDGGTARQGGQDSGAEGSVSGGGTGDDRYREAYMEGYREAMRESGGRSGGSSGSMASGEGQGGRSGDQEGASEYFGAPVAEPGEKEFEDMQDYQSASTGFQPGRGGDDEGRMRVRRLRRGS